MDVAQAAEGSRPRNAIRLCLEEVERPIAGRGRGNYAEAAVYLLRVRAVYEQMGEGKSLAPGSGSFEARLNDWPVSLDGQPPVGEKGADQEPQARRTPQGGLAKCGTEFFRNHRCIGHY